MINIIFFNTKHGSILGYEISGHSGYSEIGSDIICASVSSVSQMVANTITEILNVDANIILDEALLAVEIKEKDFKICKDILLGLKLHLCMLEEQYPQYLNVNYTEVYHD